MTDRVSERSSWFWEPTRESVRRAVWVGVVWAYVAAVAAALLMLLAAGVAFAVTGIIYLADYGARTFETGEIAAAVTVVFWLVTPVAFGVSVWSTAYASTTTQSVLRGAAGIAVGGIVALLFHLSGFSGAVLAGLGVGWSLAIPVEHPTRWAVRAVLPVVIAALIFPFWDGLSIQVVLLILLLMPALAGLFVWLSDVAYQGLILVRQRSDGGAVGRAPSSIE